MGNWAGHCGSLMIAYWNPLRPGEELCESSGCRRTQYCAPGSCPVTWRHKGISSLRAKRVDHGFAQRWYLPLLYAFDTTGWLAAALQHEPARIRLGPSQILFPVEAPSSAGLEGLRRQNLDRPRLIAGTSAAEAWGTRRDREADVAGPNGRWTQAADCEKGAENMPLETP